MKRVQSWRFLMSSSTVINIPARFTTGIEPFLDMVSYYCAMSKHTYRVGFIFHDFIDKKYVLEDSLV